VLVALALLSLTLLAFSNSFSAGFTLDNKGLLRDPRILQATAENMGLILRHSYWWPSGESGLYRPFTTFTYLTNYAILGNRDQPAGYHWVNLLLHASNVALVFLLMLRLVRQFWMSVFIAALWAVHPVLTESVTNIVGRADLLAGLATLGGFLMYLKSTETVGWRRAVWLFGLMAATAVGVISKESAVCVLGVIVLYELIWWRERRRRGALLLGCAATAIPIAVMLYQRAAVLAASLPAEFPYTDNPIVGADFWIGRLTAISVIARYVWLIVWPATLSCDYSYPEIPLASGTLGDWVSWTAVFSLIALVAFLYRRSRTAFFLACFAALTFLPMSNLLFPIGTIMAERFLYLPSIGALACLVMAIYAVSRHAGFAGLAPVIMSLIIVALAIRTWVRNSDWHDDLAIATSSLKASPNSFKLHRQMGELLFGADRTLENIERGTNEAEESVALLDTLPDSRKVADAYCLTGGYYLIRADAINKPQEYQRAIQTLLRCAAIDRSVRAAYLQKFEASPHRNSIAFMPASGDPQPHLMLSIAYLRLNDTDRAADAAKQALELLPRNPAAFRQIANIFLLKNRKEDAAVALTEGVLLTSDPALTESLLELYRNAGSNHCVLMQTCEPVRKQVCAVSTEIIKARLQTSRLDLAEQQRRTFIEDYGCSAASLDPLLPRH
jgi:tetratricopeptide (TPR) repeat protein